MKKEGIPLEKFEILLHRVLYHRARGASFFHHFFGDQNPSSRKGSS